MGDGNMLSRQKIQRTLPLEELYPRSYYRNHSSLYKLALGELERTSHHMPDRARAEESLSNVCNKTGNSRETARAVHL